MMIAHGLSAGAAEMQQDPATAHAFQTVAYNKLSDSSLVCSDNTINKQLVLNAILGAQTVVLNNDANAQRSILFIYKPTSLEAFWPSSVMIAIILNPDNESIREVKWLRFEPGVPPLPGLVIQDHASCVP